MKTWRLPLVIALASMGLAACDVQVRDTPSQSSAAADVQQAVPVASTAPASPPPATDVATTRPMPADSTGTAAAPAPSADSSLVPPTAQMGAAPAGNDMAAMPSDGVAAPTELQRFFEQTAGATGSNGAQGETTPAAKKDKGKDAGK